MTSKKYYFDNNKHFYASFNFWPREKLKYKDYFSVFRVSIRNLSTAADEVSNVDEA